MYAIRGLSTPGNSYSSFVADYFDLVSLLRRSLLWAVRNFSAWLGMETTQVSEFILRKSGGSGIILIYSCLGIGVSSVWTAFTIAYGGKLKTITAWLFGGLLLQWVINVLRLTMVLFGVNSQFKFPFGIDHHTWFNIIAYILILTMMYLRSRKQEARSKTNE